MVKIMLNNYMKPAEEIRLSPKYTHFLYEQRPTLSSMKFYENLFRMFGAA